MRAAYVDNMKCKAGIKDNVTGSKLEHYEISADNTKNKIPSFFANACKTVNCAPDMTKCVHPG